MLIFQHRSTNGMNLQLRSGEVGLSATGDTVPTCLGDSAETQGIVDMIWELKS